MKYYDDPEPLGEVGGTAGTGGTAGSGGTSVVGVGTEYKLRLKPAAVKLTVVRAPTPQQGNEAELPRVLVVDDEPAVLRALQRILRGMYEVDVASSGNIALEMVVSNSYQAVLCDLQMPSPDGVAIYHHIVEQVPKLAAHLAFMTGGALSGHIAGFMEEVEKMGIVVLDKPFDQRQVRELMSELIGRHG